MANTIWTQTKIDETNKLDPGFIQTSTTFQPVSNEEKTNWNNKQEKLVAGTGININPTTNEISASGVSLTTYVKNAAVSGNKLTLTKVDSGSESSLDYEPATGGGEPIWYSVTGTEGETVPLNADTLNGKTYADIHAEIQEGTGVKFPVGYIYLSVVSTDPSYYFGGTWEQLKDTFLLGAGNTYTAGSTGGEATHTLTIAEMPNHAHEYYWSPNDHAGNAYPYAAGSHLKSSRVTESVGGGQAHNNMPPYLTVYMWKKVAD